MRYIFFAMFGLHSALFQGQEFQINKIKQELLEQLMLDQIGRRVLNIEDIQRMITNYYNQTNPLIMNQLSQQCLKSLQQFQEIEFDRVNIESSILKCFIYQYIFPSVEMKLQPPYIQEFVQLLQKINMNSYDLLTTDEYKALSLSINFQSFGEVTTIKDLLVLSLKSQLAFFMTLVELNSILFPKQRYKFQQLELISSHSKVVASFIFNPELYMPKSDADFVVIKRQITECVPFKLVICKYSEAEWELRLAPDYQNLRKFKERIKSESQQSELQRRGSLDEYGKYYKNGVFQKATKEDLRYVDYLQQHYQKSTIEQQTMQEISSKKADCQKKFDSFHVNRMAVIAAENRQRRIELQQQQNMQRLTSKCKAFSPSANVGNTQKLLQGRQQARAITKIECSTQKTKSLASNLKIVPFPDPPSVEQITAFADVDKPIKIGRIYNHLPPYVKQQVLLERNFPQIHQLDDQLVRIQVSKSFRNQIQVPISVSFLETFSQHSCQYNRSRWIKLQQQEPCELLLLSVQQYIKIAIQRSITIKKQNTQDQQQLLTQWGEKVLRIASARPIPENYAPILTNCGRFTQYLNIDSGQTETIHPEVMKAQHHISSEFSKLEACVKIKPGSLVIQFINKLDQFLDFNIYFASESYLQIKLELNKLQADLIREVSEWIGSYFDDPQDNSVIINSSFEIASGQQTERKLNVRLTE